MVTSGTGRLLAIGWDGVEGSVGEGWPAAGRLANLASTRGPAPVARHTQIRRQPAQDHERRARLPLESLATTPGPPYRCPGRAGPNPAIRPDAGGLRRGTLRRPPFLASARRSTGHGGISRRRPG